MNGHASIITLFHDERSGVRPAETAREVRRFHRNRNGSVSVLFLFMGFVFFGMAAMVWNTGQTISAKLRVQTAADTAAYSSAVWTSRAVNITTATNMLIYRNAAAYPIATAATATMVGVPLVYFIRGVIALIRVAATSFIDWSAMINWAQSVAREMPIFLLFLSEAIPAAPAQTIHYWNKVSNLYGLQKELIDKVPILIDQQRLVFEDACDCEIKLTQPGHAGAIRPPLRPGNRMSILPVIALHFPANFKGWNICCWGRLDAKSFERHLKSVNKKGYEQSLKNRKRVKDKGKKVKQGPLTPPKPKKGAKGKKKGSLNPCRCSAINLSKVRYGFAKVWWMVGLAGGLATIVAKPPEHHVLTTQWGPFEFGPSSLATWRDYTVVATATDDVSDDFIAPGIFRTPISVTAYAQAETYNAVDQRIPNLPYPFRVWTEWGWKWESRLTLGDQLETAIKNDRQLRRQFKDLGAEASDVRKIKPH